MSPHGRIDIDHMPKIKNKGQCSTKGKIEKRMEKNQQKLSRQKLEIILLTAKMNL